MEPDTSYNKVEWPFSGEAKRGGEEGREEASTRVALKAKIES